MILRLRISKRSKIHDAVASAWENMGILRAGIEMCSDPDHRDGTYVRGIRANNPPEEKVNDEHKIVLEQKFALTYRINAELK
jgi:hypothetical protein